MPTAETPWLPQCRGTFKNHAQEASFVWHQVQKIVKAKYVVHGALLNGVSSSLLPTWSHPEPTSILGRRGTAGRRMEWMTHGRILTGHWRRLRGLLSVDDVWEGSAEPKHHASNHTNRSLARWARGEREVSGGLGCHVEEGMAVSFVPSYWVESSLLDELRWVSLQ